VTRTPASLPPAAVRGWRRALRLRLAVMRYVLRRLGPPLLAAVAYTLAAAWVYWWDLRRTGAGIDYGGALYAIYTQIFFEPTAALPSGPVGRAVLWITPLAGVFLIAEGLVKVGASLFDLAGRREVWVKLMSEQMREHVVVCGLGQVGYRVVQELHELGEQVVGVEHDERDSFVDEVQALGVPVHLGDARRDDVLVAAGINRARAVICATGDDLANLEVALDVKRLSPGTRVLMRMFDQRLAAKVGGTLALDQSFSTSALAAPLVALQATQPEVLSAYRVGTAIRVTAVLPVGQAAAGMTVARLEADCRCRVVARNESTDALSAVEKLIVGDRIVVDVAVGALRALRARLGSASR
jgi:Trk K+ transport system NAD-binding subunit